MNPLNYFDLMPTDHHCAIGIPSKMARIGAPKQSPSDLRIHPEASVFLYFVPTESPPTLRDLCDHNIGFAFEAKSFVTVALKDRRGPKSQSGYLVSQSGSPGYDPDKQTWHSHSKPGVHFGWWNRSAPTPDSLIRENKIDGRPVELGDGNLWEIPIARKWSEGDGDQSGRVVWDDNNLTRTLTMKDGQWVHNSVISEQVLFSEIGRAIFDHWVEHVGEASFPLPNNEAQLCSDVLAVNYRLSSYEVSALGLLTSCPNLLWSILREVIDVTGWAELIKKKGLDAQTSTVGSTDSTDNTDQPTQI